MERLSHPFFGSGCRPPLPESDPISVCKKTARDSSVLMQSTPQLQMQFFRCDSLEMAHYRGVERAIWYGLMYIGYTLDWHTDHSNQHRGLGSEW